MSEDRAEIWKNVEIEMKIAKIREETGYQLLLLRLNFDIVYFQSKKTGAWGYLASNNPPNISTEDLLTYSVEALKKVTENFTIEV